jgi:hypothetical protein
MRIRTCAALIFLIIPYLNTLSASSRLSHLYKIYQPRRSFVPIFNPLSTALRKASFSKTTYPQKISQNAYTQILQDASHIRDLRKKSKTKYAEAEISYSKTAALFGVTFASPFILHNHPIVSMTLTGAELLVALIYAQKTVWKINVADEMQGQADSHESDLIEKLSQLPLATDISYKLVDQEADAVQNAEKALLTLVATPEIKCNK